MKFAANFGAAAASAGYQFFDATGLVGARVTAGVVNVAGGVYVATATPPTGAVGILWTNDNPATRYAVEDIQTRVLTEATLDDAISDVIAEIEAIPSVDTASIADAVWDEAHAGHSTADTTGFLLRKLNVGDATDTVTPVPAAGTDATLCRVYGYLEDVENNRVANTVISFRLITPGGGIKSERIITGRTATATSDADGFFSIYLQRNDNLTPADSYYSVTCKAIGLDGVEMELEAALYDIADLIE